MIKRSKAVYIIGSIIIGMLSVLAVYFALIGAGVVNVTVRRITLTSSSLSREYDGTDLTANEYKITDGSLSKGHNLNVKFTGVQNDAGISQNFFTATVTDDNGVDCTADYNITYQYGTLEVKQRAITLASDSANKTYDKTPLSSDNCWIQNGSLISGHELIVETVSEAVETGTVANEMKATVINADGKDVTKNYAFNYETGLLTINPIKIKITTASFNKIYDGEPVKAENYIISDGELLEGDEIVASGYSELTAIGEAENKVTLTVKDALGEDVSKNYEFEFDYGKLEITPIPLVIESASDEKEFDGTPLTNNYYVHVNPEALLEGHTLQSVVVNGSQTAIGGSEHNNTLDFKVVDKDGNDVTDLYTIDAERLGTLIVTKIKITVRLNYARQMYDGTEHKSSEAGYSVSEVDKAKMLKTVLDDGTEITDELQIDTDSYIPASGTEIGNYNGKYNSWKVLRGGVDASSWYELEFEGGLKIMKRPIRVELESYTKAYDGEPLYGGVKTDASGKKICHNLLDGHTLEYVALKDAVLIAVGSQYYTVVTAPIDEEDNQSFIVKDENGNDVSEYYVMLPPEREGLLTVTASETQQTYKILEFTSNAADGRVLLKQSDYANNVRGVTWNDANLLSLTYNGKTYEKQELSELELRLALARMNGGLLRNGKVKLENAAYGVVYPYYLSELTSGIGNPYTFNYVNFDYFSGTKKNYTQEYKAIEAAYRSFAYESYLNVNDATRTALEKVIKTKRFAFHTRGGSYVKNDIDRVVAYLKNAITYNLNSPDLAKLDADENLTVTLLCGDGKLEGVCRHYATAGVMLFRALGYPARYATGFAADVKTANEPVEVTTDEAHAWVEIYIDGFGWIPLDVTGGNAQELPQDGSEVNVRLKNVYVSYDGSEHSYEDKYTLSSDGYYHYDGKNADCLVGFNKLASKGYTYKVKFSAKAIMQGKTIVEVEDFKLFNENGEEVEPKTKKLGHGEFQVYKYTLSVTTETETKVYDGTPLKSSKPATCTITSHYDDEYLNHNISATVDNEITSAGKRVNSAVIKITDETGEDVTDLYRINARYGELIVDQLEITIQAGSKNLTYEEWIKQGGGKVTCEQYFVIKGADILENLGHTIIACMFKETSFVDEEGTSAENIIDSVVIRDKSGNDVTNNYNYKGNLKNGELSIGFDE